MAQPDICHQHPRSSVSNTAARVPFTSTLGLSGNSSPAWIWPDSGYQVSQLEHMVATSSAQPIISFQYSEIQFGFTTSSACSIKAHSMSAVRRAKPELIVVRSPALLRFEQISNGTVDRQADLAAATVPSRLASSKTRTALMCFSPGLFWRASNVCAIVDDAL